MGDSCANSVLDVSTGHRKNLKRHIKGERRNQLGTEVSMEQPVRFRPVSHGLKEGIEGRYR